MRSIASSPSSREKFSSPHPVLRAVRGVEVRATKILLFTSATLPKIRAVF
ncbi:MAG: hypothetical protein IH623_31700 [Verrucomicrobia bacterium]|nr:hypothetical protein [Verrucomicrobiota bacterium]